MPPGLAIPLQGHYSRLLEYAPVMRFTTEELDLMDRTHEVEIETSRPGGPIHRTIIWVVVDDGEVFIRSYRGPDARWYREALAQPSVALHVDGRRIAARAIPSTDPRSIERASTALVRKYPGDPATRRMNRPEVLDLTLRLEPA
jgi:hypothetical protein